MKKFVFLYCRDGESPKGDVEAWTNWFKSAGDVWVDIGNPFGQSKEVTSTEVKDGDSGALQATGYSIVKAADMDAAVAIAKSCPATDCVKVYEALPM